MFDINLSMCVLTDTYDGLTASGCFGIGHIPFGALYGMIRIVKPGNIYFKRNGLFHVDNKALVIT